MSAIMIHDVTKAVQAMPNAVHKKKSTITPFQTILDQEEEIVSRDISSKKVSGEKAEKTTAVPDTTKTTTSKSASSEGETTLKDIFERAAKKYDISYDFLVAVAKAESDFNSKCVSSAGAQGIMQVMPEEQKGLGIKDPFDPEQNIMGAAKLLKAHLKKFNGDYTLAAAAYNAGSGRVQKYGGVPPFKETQNYVKKINKYMKEGVTVPDRKVNTSSKDSTVGSGASTGTKAAETTEKKESFEEGTTASSADLEKVTVAIGTGDNRMTMTYGAYLKYLEMGSAGVG